MDLTNRDNSLLLFSVSTKLGAASTQGLQSTTAAAHITLVSKNKDINFPAWTPTLALVVHTISADCHMLGAIYIKKLSHCRSEGMKSIRQPYNHKWGWRLTRPRGGAFIHTYRKTEHTISVVGIHIGEDELHSCQQSPLWLQYKDAEYAM